MRETFTWDGTEEKLYELLMWMMEKFPYQHSEDCVDSEVTLHCCSGLPTRANAQVGMEARTVRHGGPLPIYFEFTKGKRAGLKYQMSPGDQIFFEDGKFSFLESWECVVIGQDWP